MAIQNVKDLHSGITTDGVSIAEGERRGSIPRRRMTRGGRRVTDPAAVNWASQLGTEPSALNQDEVAGGQSPETK